MRSFAALSLLTVASSAVAARTSAAPKSALRRRQYGNYGNDNNYGGDDNDNGGGGGGGTLDPNLLCTGCQQDGLADADEGQSASITSNENFINFCGGQDGGPQGLPITNGQQIDSGSCNPVPMGVIASTSRMPASKFVFPKNLDTIQSNTAFTIQMAIQNLNTGVFVNPDSNYYAAPCFADESGTLIGHSHVTVQLISDLTTTDISDPGDFEFFKGINTAAENGILTADVTDGLAAGTYRLGSINACANHQAVMVAVAQRGMTDDVVYFTVSDNAGGDNGGNDGQDAVDNANGNYYQGQDDAAADDAAADDAAADDAAADDAAAGDQGNYYGGDQGQDQGQGGNYYGQDDQAQDDAAADDAAAGDQGNYYGGDQGQGGNYYGQDDQAQDDAAAAADDAAAGDQGNYYGGDQGQGGNYYGQDDQAQDDAAADDAAAADQGNYYGGDQGQGGNYYGQDDQAADDAAAGGNYYGGDQNTDDQSADTGNYDGGYGGGSYGGGYYKRSRVGHDAAKALLSSHKRMTRLSKRRLALENVA